MLDTHAPGASLDPLDMTAPDAGASVPASIMSSQSGVSQEPLRTPALAPVLPTPTPTHAQVLAATAALTAARTLVPLQPRPQLPPANVLVAMTATSASLDEPSTARSQVMTLSPPVVATAPEPVLPTKTRVTPVLPRPASAGSDSASSQHSDRQTNGGANVSTTPRSRTMKRCTVPLCESYARSRGLCKAHGGGKRCNRPGCELSDQGGGLCIRHGGGKRCQMEGCTKSAQSRHFCKAHGGGARCKVEGCVKSSQGGGLCRGHGGGPRRKKLVNARGEPIESPRSRTRSRFRANIAARVLADAAQAIEDKTVDDESAQPAASWLTEQDKLAPPVECEKGKTALSFKIRPIEPKTPVKVVSEAADDANQNGEGDEKTAATLQDKPPGVCRVGGCDNRLKTLDRELCDEHNTHLFVAASLLGMQTAPSE